ncbi:MAG TPA: protein kinase [Polyangiaceae bacterium]|jgi:serine/threonine-protein kinase
MDRRPRGPDGASGSAYAETVAATPVVITPLATPPAGSAADESAATAGGSRYVVLERLGEGGMGEVRLCHDELLGRDVARKQMRRAIACHPDLQARFLREARVQARLEHPSIVPVYDLDVESGAPFFTMKRVRGSTLGEILARLAARESDAVESYSRHRLLAAFASVCLTVELAHESRVVHRDLKPDNVMLGSYGELYVLDWGIAKIADEPARAPRHDAEQGAVRTRTDSFLGTPGYMAPEQLEEPSGVDARADVYALGAILFEIVTLQPLHAIADAAQMMAATLRGVEARPSVRVPGCNTAPELDAICAKATARRREDRYPSVRALHDALEHYRRRDRDLEQRRARAVEHARRAEAAAAEATSEVLPDAPRRVLALREASRALALDPSHAGAFEVIGKLLASPPRVLPPEVDRELGDATAALYRTATRGGAFLLLTWFAYVPFALAIGIRNVPLYVGVSALFALAALASWRESRKHRPAGSSPLWVLFVVGAPIALLATVWSPLVFVAPMTIPFAAGMILFARTRTWPVRQTALACAIVVAPIVLALTGLVPPFFAFEGGRIVLLPVMLALPATLTALASAFILVLVVISIFWWSVRLRRALSAAERQLHLYTWHLRQLLERDPRRGGRTLPPQQGGHAAAGFVGTVVDTVVAAGVDTGVDTGAGRVGLDAPFGDTSDVATRYVATGEDSAPGEGSILGFEDRRIGRRVVMRRVDAGASPEAREELLAEVRIRARLEHPAIPPVYEMATGEDGTSYFTARRPRGMTLAEAVGTGKHTLHHLVEAFAAACQAVEYAHASGVFHRGLGPGCIVVGDYGEVYVTGWRSAATASADHDPASLARADVDALVAVLASIVAAAQRTDVDDEGGVLLPEGAAMPPELEAIAATPAGAASAAQLSAAVSRFLEGERDTSQRRARAAEHVAFAEQAMASALASDGGGAEDRAAAVRSVSHALALDPSNARAAAVMMKLLTEPPRTLPPQAEHELSAAERAGRRRSSRIACFLYLTWFVYAPFVLTQPGASVPLVVALSVAFGAAAAAFWRASRAGTRRVHGELGTVVFSMLAAASLGAVAGPLVLVPTMVVGNVIGFVLQGGSRRRAVVLALACLAFAGPVALQALRIIPASYVAKGEALAIVPHLVAQTPASQVILILIEVMVVFAACVFFRRFRDARNRAEEEIHVHAWQLRQLVPIDAPRPPGARGTVRGCESSQTG